MRFFGGMTVCELFWALAAPTNQAQAPTHAPFTAMCRRSGFSNKLKKNLPTSPSHPLFSAKEFFNSLKNRWFGKSQGDIAWSALGCSTHSNSKNMYCAQGQEAYYGMNPRFCT
jgi:hypothetical protein